MPRFRRPVYIFVSGGVISGLGKGITAASTGLLLKSAGFRVSLMKVDMYLNVDAGTMNPLEHGEVFVLKDGLETDQDLGHYERFLGEDFSRDNYLTAGQVYLDVIKKERALEYNGACVDAFFKVPEAITEYFEKAAEGRDFLIVEFGGTVGEYQNVLFFEAARRLRIRHPGQVLFIHVVYLPLPRALGEMKSKPAQQSIASLNGLGISPNVIVCRSGAELDVRRKEKIALAAALPERCVLSNPDIESIYEVPLVLKKQGLEKIIFSLVGAGKRQLKLGEWETVLKSVKKKKRKLQVAIVGKYYASGQFSLSDSYVSVIEALKTAGYYQDLEVEIVWVNSEEIEKSGDCAKIFDKVGAVVVPGGFGSRGVEGKIRAITYARENKIPYLGLCYGMQLAVVEYARSVLGMMGANTTEVNPKTVYPVVDLMDDQEKKLLAQDYGGSMRLGNWDCCLQAGSLVEKCYRQRKAIKGRVVIERHRHRWEVNNKYRVRLEKGGLMLSGLSPDGKLVEAIELPESEHPFFVGTQFHPELKSQFLKPHPLFYGLVAAGKKRLGIK